MLILAFCVVFMPNVAARDIDPKPMHYELPGWFKKTFLEIPVDIQDAQTRGKKLMIFFIWMIAPTALTCSRKLH